MNQAARLAARGEGWVMPMVLMKAFERKRRNFMSCASWRISIVTERKPGVFLMNLGGVASHLLVRVCWLVVKGLPPGEWGHTLKGSVSIRRFDHVDCICYP